MIDTTFCSLLEYKIGNALKESSDEEAKHFWCDGVAPGPEHEYSQTYVNNNRKTTMTAYIGKTGQEAYELILHFGKKAMSRYARGLDIAACIPETPAETWFEIDIVKRRIQIQLN